MKTSRTSSPRRQIALAACLSSALIAGAFASTASAAPTTIKVTATATIDGQGRAPAAGAQVATYGADGQIRYLGTTDAAGRATVVMDIPGTKARVMPFWIVTWAGKSVFRNYSVRPGRTLNLRIPVSRNAIPADGAQLPAADPTSPTTAYAVIRTSFLSGTPGASPVPAANAPVVMQFAGQSPVYAGITNGEGQATVVINTGSAKRLRAKVWVLVNGYNRPVQVTLSPRRATTVALRGGMSPIAP